MLRCPFDLHFLGTPQAFVLSQDQTLRQRSNCQRHKATDKTFRSSGCKPFIQGPAITNLAALLDLEVTQKTNRQTFAHSVTLFGCQGARTPPQHCSCLVAGVCSRSSNGCGAHSLDHGFWLSLLLVSATLHYTPHLHPCQGPLSRNLTDFMNFRTKNRRTNHNERAALDCSPEAWKAWKASLQEALQARSEAGK